MRILTWNAQGDKSREGGTAGQKALELCRVLDYWRGDDAVAIVCLQELARDGSALRKALLDRRWSVSAAPENEDRGGRFQAIAVSPGLRIDRFKVIDLPVPGVIPSGPLRSPCCGEISLPAGGEPLVVMTWHATRGPQQQLYLRAFSDHIAQSRELQGRKIIIAADLNCTGEQLNRSGLFRGFSGFSFGPDHIIAKNIPLRCGFDSSEGHSDHSLISARFGGIR